jgi:hypothetical protein
MSQQTIDKKESGTSSFVGAGFTPRLNPRPQYPSGWHMLWKTSTGIAIQSGLLGTVLCLLLYPYFLIIVERLRLILGEKGSDRLIFTILSNATHTGAYVVINGSFGLFDYFKLFQQYKLARKPYMIPSRNLIISTLFHAALGQLVINPLATYYLYPSMVRMGLMNLTDPLPSIRTVFWVFCFADLFNGFGFYVAHRTLHSKLLYAAIHKQHHEYQGTIGITAEHANPIEQVLANMIPTLGGVLLSGSHPIIFCVWLVIIMFSKYFLCSHVLILSRSF